MMNPRTLVRDLAGAITAKDYFARDASGDSFMFTGMVYTALMASGEEYHAADSPASRSSGV